MKKIAFFACVTALLLSCNNDDDNQNTTPSNTNVEVNFTQNFDGTPFNERDLDNTTFTNANGEVLTITRLRYLMTDITFTNSAGIATEVEDYNLVWIEAGETKGLSLSPDISLPEGNYSLTMRFGFSENNNTTNAYTDLNAASWNVPGPLGGGYHYQQMDGKYTNTAGVVEGFNFHTIAAPIDPMTPEVSREDTSIALNLGTVAINGTNTTIEVVMNIAEWFKNPNQWDLNILDTMLMGNYDAQKMMEENGQTVFSLGIVVNN